MTTPETQALGCAKTVVDLENEIESLRARVEQYREDAERYRFLRGGADTPEHSERWARWEVRNWCGRWWNTLFAGQLDAAIDKARTA